MASKKTTKHDSVTIEGLPGHPENVGESITRRGEERVKEEGRDKGRVDLGKKGASNRPAGGSTARAMSGVDPQDPGTASGKPKGDGPKGEKPKGDKKVRKA